jgi:biotin transporter BioY
MYTLISLLPLRRLLREQMPALGLAWVIAELLYKFKSFTLECIAFLVTWFVLDAIIQLIVRHLAKRSEQSMP